MDEELSPSQFLFSVSIPRNSFQLGVHWENSVFKIKL